MADAVEAADGREHLVGESGEGQLAAMLRGGAAFAALAYEVLQLVGGLYLIRHVLERSVGTPTAPSALVIGLVSWLYLVAYELP